MFRLACDALDEFGECASPYWVVDSWLPPLDYQGAVDLSSSALLLFALVFCWRMFRRTL
jgi:hypothetical protein